MTPSRRRLLLPVLLAGACLLVLALAWLATVIYRGSVVFDEMMASGLGNVGRVYAADPRLGYVPAPGARSVDRVPLGAPVAVRHDAAGLRVPASATVVAAGRHPRLLFLGDSFTYGRMVAAEDTFAWRTAALLGGEALNAGANGYGLADMVLRARELVPRYRPDIVVVQFSPWLVARAMDEFAPGDTGSTARRFYMPVPYYTGRRNVEIAPPVFGVGPELAIVPNIRFTETPGLGDRLDFLWNVALPVLRRQDAKLAWFQLRRGLGLVPRPSTNGVEVIRQAYADIAAVAARQQARVIILAIGSAEPMAVPSPLFPEGVAVVDGWQAMVARLPEPSALAYERAYMTWRGNPPRLVDWHPNERAHALLADVLAAQLRPLPRH